jgi:hypothetical protein
MVSSFFVICHVSVDNLHISHIIKPCIPSIIIRFIRIGVNRCL